MKKTIFIFSILLLLFCTQAYCQNGRWSKEKAWQWYNSQPWFCGVNYIPANAINYTAMWDKTSFSPKVIDKELSLMKSLKMNCVRVVMQYAVYADDPKYFIKTLDKFLSICQKNDIKAMLIFFDDCTFGVNTDPVIGKQPEPLEGWYAWAWSPSPGYSMVVDERTHYKLEKYVKGVMKHFANDNRIMAWDLYNEPTNTTMPERSLPLLYKVFKWAREINPSQPITSCIWNSNKKVNDFLSENSDIITFHCYSDSIHTLEFTKRMLEFGRPVICTEWMNRPAKSYYSTILPIFKENNVGSMSWGLVNGKDQTNLPWGHRPEMGKYTGEWQHDLFKGDYTPYDQKDIETIKKCIGSK